MGVEIRRRSCITIRSDEFRRSQGKILDQPIIDIHVHIIPHHVMKPDALELITRGRTDFDEVERYCHSPKDFLRYLDSINVERAGLINYVAPEIIGFTPA